MIQQPPAPGNEGGSLPQVATSEDHLVTPNDMGAVGADLGVAETAR